MKSRRLALILITLLGAFAFLYPLSSATPTPAREFLVLRQFPRSEALESVSATERAKEIVLGHPRLSARDAVHLAVMDSMESLEF